MKLSAELLIKLNNLKAVATEFSNKEGVTAAEITAKMEEIKVVKAKYNLALQNEADEAEEFENANKTPISGALVKESETNAIYTDAFYNALRGKSLTEQQATVLSELNNALSSTAGADGGYLIPIDQQVAIRELKREFLSLESLVNIEPVSTLTGNRNIEKDAEYVPFAEFTEGNDVPDTDTPQFVNISYAIKDRGGILPIPNNLLADNTANLQAYLNRWLAKKNVATRNKLIVDLLLTLSKTAITGIDDVKNVLNVTLDPAIAAMAVVVMNQDSFNKFDKMKDSDGNYLLEKDPTNPTRKLLAGKPIYVYSNKTIKTVAGKAPVIIGSLKEMITLFDREQMSLLSTQIGGGAFKGNRTDIRAITREDVQKVDTAAVVYGEIVV